MLKDVVLWNSKETRERCEAFIRDYAKMRKDLYDHYKHKGHLALRYEDSWKGFLLYCRERLRLELNEATIKLQINTAQVSEEVGVEVPMVISRHIAKLPAEKQKEVYDEVIGAREKAGQRSANQMEPDVRKVVRREMGMVEPPPAVLAPGQNVITVPPTDTDEFVPDISLYVPRTAELLPEEPNYPTALADALETAYIKARDALCTFVSAYEANDAEAMLALYMDVRQFLATNT